MKHSIFFILLYVLCSFNASENTPQKKSCLDIAETRWLGTIAPGCVSEYYFKKDSTYLYYSCEREFTFFGDFSFQHDTLILYSKGALVDEFLPEDSPHRFAKQIYWCTIELGCLKHIASSIEIGGEFQTPKLANINTTICYKKIEGDSVKKLLIDN